MNMTSQIMKALSTATARPFNTMLLLTIALSISGNTYSNSSNNSQSWEFRVFLDDDEIGFHHFSVVDKGDHKEIYSKARFDVKFLFFNAYSYQHENVERWHDGCLQNINALTNDNGEEYKVLGMHSEEAFIVTTVNTQNTYPACIKSFAYWDPQFLREKSLLNSQTGEMMEVESRFIGNESIPHQGKIVDARRYRLSGDELQIDLWYSKDNRWLALESLTEGGRIVRYAIP
jgi:hypothetical protein